VQNRYEIVAGNLETFLALQSERDRPVPRFVERELRNFLDCGVLAIFTIDIIRHLYFYQSLTMKLGETAAIKCRLYLQHHT